MMTVETRDAEPAPKMVIESKVTGEALSRVMAAKELLRLERRIERAEEALRILRVHRERLLGLIGKP